MKKFLIPLLILACWLGSCKKEDDPFVDDLKNLVVGSSIDLGTTTIGTSGGQVRISRPGTAVDGLEIDIPANAFSSEQHVKVTFAEIKSHDLGPNVNPISPLINIRMEGGYADGLMRLTIPVTIPEGHIPIGFYYDGSNGKLEGIPFESISPTSITLLTRHFSAPSELKSTGSTQQAKSASATGGANILISSISESLLNGQAIIASGFKPGTDDWEFVNRGSYISPWGHCAGQTIAAMWYYFEKKPTEGSLFNKFSELPNLWQDNVHGYRFCSVLQEDTNWDGRIATLFDQYIDKNQELDRLKLMTIAATMLVTGEPQAIAIYRQTGVDQQGKPIYGGHAVICYQLSVNGGKMFISDPNTPATGQVINFVENRFQPYLAKLNGDDASHPYPFVTFFAKTAVIEWDQIGKRWEEVRNKTIGNVAPNAFPAYTIRIKDASGIELTDGMKVTEDTLKLVVECPTAEVCYQVLDKRLIGLEIYDKEGQGIGASVNNYIRRVLLKPGSNKLGIYIYGFRESSKDENGKYRNKFVDFKWITVNYLPLVIDPDPLNGEPNQPYKFTARSKGAAPASAKYVWNFGDGSNPETVVNDSTVNHNFAKEGSFRVKVELFDHSTNTKVADTVSVANIQEVSPIPVVDSVGYPLYFKNGTRFVPWGVRSIGTININIYGKDWVADSKKTFVKVDGDVVPITNLISVGSGEYEVNTRLITIDIPANKKGNVSITVESNGIVSEPKDFFIGIPLSALQKMPVTYLQNQFQLEYINSNQGNKLETNSYSFSFFKAYDQIISTQWNGNVLTISGFIQYPVGYQNTELQAVYTFSEDGTEVTNVDTDITSLNLDITQTTKGIPIDKLDYQNRHLWFARSRIPAADYSRVSGQAKTTEPRYIYTITRIIEGGNSWPNEMRLYLEFVH